MGDFSSSVVIPRPREMTFEYLRTSSNYLKLFPESATRNLDAKFPEILQQGSSIEVNFKAMGNHFQIVHGITEFRQDVKIVATQLQGPFKQWVCEQHFADSPHGGTLLTTSIDFKPPGGMLGFVVTRKRVLSKLEEWIPRGHEMLRQAIENGQV
jgi:ligand-binding SRPBCC domain-containing protein